MSWRRTPPDETPEKTVENVPDDVVERLLNLAAYVECSECGNRQWNHTLPGHNVRGTCDECGNTEIV